MSTRSYVGYVNDDFSGNISYVHFDGYLDGVGADLLEEYNTWEDAQRLGNKGAMSTLEKEPYGDEDPIPFSNLQELIHICKKSDCEYVYLYDHQLDTWVCSKVYSHMSVGDFKKIYFDVGGSVYFDETCEVYTEDND